MKNMQLLITGDGSMREPTYVTTYFTVHIGALHIRLYHTISSSNGGTKGILLFFQKT